MKLAGQAAIAGHDGQVTSGKPERPKSWTFTREFKAKIVAEFGALPANGPERGALLRKNRLYHSHIEDWRRQPDSGSPASGRNKEKPAKAAEPAELAWLLTGSYPTEEPASRAARRHPPVPRDRPHPGQAEKNR